MLQGISFSTTETSAAEKLLAELGQVFTLVPAEEIHSHTLFSDTFDWALYRAGWALEISGSHYRLLDRAGGLEIAAGEESTVHVPRFAWEFADPDLRTWLQPRLKVRALIRLLGLSGQGRRFSVRNRDGDLLGRCDLTTLHLVRGGRTDPFLVLCSFGPLPPESPLVIQARRLCVESGWDEAPPVVLDLALRRAGVTPAANAGKNRVPLESGLPTGEAARRIARSLVAVMKINLPGLRKDVDTEFLHDFRVAVRRTRSLLKLMDRVFPEKVLEEFVPAFRTAGRATGPLRDLDVYLLRRREFGALVPAVLYPGLEEYFGELAARRAAARASLTAYLDGSDYPRMLRRWEQFLSRDTSAWPAAPEAAAQPVMETARLEIRRLFRRILRCGSRVTPEAQDRSLHRLRIRCKELRYALEFFSSLFPTPAHGQLVGQLKALQDMLGEFNDLSVQMAHLTDLLEGRDDRPIPVREAATLGALIFQLHQRKQTVRERFAPTFADFSAGTTRKLVKAMLDPG